MHRKPLARLALGLLAVAIAPGMTRGQSPSSVLDGAGMFSEVAIREARGELARIDRTFDVRVNVETVESLRGQGIDEFATRRAEQLGHQGIFVLIARKEHKADVLASPRALREELGIARLNAIRDTFTDQFRKDQLDLGLTKGIQAASAALGAIRPAARAEGTVASVGPGAATSPLVLRQQVRLTLAGARRALAGAEAKALEKGYKMNIAAVDDGGHLLAFARMDGARPASIATATTKAVTAATFRQATGTLPIGGKEPDLLLNLSLQNAASASGGKLTTLLGGVPIVVDGQVIGALGVGGGSGDQDAEVARAGVAAFVLGLQEPAKEKAGEARPKPDDFDDEEGFGRIPGKAEAKPAEGSPRP